MLSVPTVQQTSEVEPFAPTGGKRRDPAAKPFEEVIGERRSRNEEKIRFAERPEQMKDQKETDGVKGGKKTDKIKDHKEDEIPDKELCDSADYLLAAASVQVTDLPVSNEPIENSGQSDALEIPTSGTGERDSEKTNVTDDRQVDLILEGQKEKEPAKTDSVLKDRPDPQAGRTEETVEEDFTVQDRTRAGAAAKAESTEPADGGEIMARMPQMKEALQKAVADTDVEKSDSVITSPLENESNRIPEAVKTGENSGQASPEEDGEEGTENIANSVKTKAKADTPEEAEQVKVSDKKSAGTEKTASPENTAPLQTMDVAAEKVLGSQQMERAAQSAKPVHIDNLFEEMVARVDLSKETSSMEIQLRPEFLGKVTVQLTLVEGGLQAKISAEDPAVRSMIGSQISALTDSLSAKGIKVTDIDVVYSGISDRGFESQQRGSHETAGGRREVRAGAVNGPGDLHGSQQIYYESYENGAVNMMDAGISSVEYTA